MSQLLQPFTEEKCSERVGKHNSFGEMLCQVFGIAVTLRTCAFERIP